MIKRSITNAGLPANKRTHVDENFDIRGSPDIAHESIRTIQKWTTWLFVQTDGFVRDFSTLNKPIAQAAAAVKEAISILVVFGDQSAGKSAALSTITGLPFVSGSGRIVTRFPIFIHQEHNRTSCELKFFSNGDLAEAKKDLSLKELVAELTRYAEKQAASDDEAAGTLNVLCQRAELYIPALNGIELTVVDLPGVRAETPQFWIDQYRKLLDRPQTTVLHIVNPLTDIDNINSRRYLVGVPEERVFTIFTNVDAAISCDESMLARMNHTFRQCGTRRVGFLVPHRDNVAVDEQRELELLAKTKRRLEFPQTATVGRVAIQSHISQLRRQRIAANLSGLKHAVGNLEEGITQRMEVLAETRPDPQTVKTNFVLRLTRRLDASLRTSGDTISLGLSQITNQQSVNQLVAAGHLAYKNRVGPGTKQLLETLQEQIDRCRGDALPGTEGIWPVVKKHLVLMVASIKDALVEILDGAFRVVVEGIVKEINDSPVAVRDATRAMVVDETRLLLAKIRTEYQAQFMEDLKMRIENIHVSIPSSVHGQIFSSFVGGHIETLLKKAGKSTFNIGELTSIMGGTQLSEALINGWPEYTNSYILEAWKLMVPVLLDPVVSKCRHLGGRCVGATVEMLGQLTSEGFDEPAATTEERKKLKAILPRLSEFRENINKFQLAE